MERGFIQFPARITSKRTVFVLKWKLAFIANFSYSVIFVIRGFITGVMTNTIKQTIGNCWHIFVCFDEDSNSSIVPPHIIRRRTPTVNRSPNSCMKCNSRSGSRACVHQCRCYRIFLAVLWIAVQHLGFLLSGIWFRL